MFYVAANDFIASIGIALGNQRDGSFGCYFQGIVTNFNYLSAIMWTTVICYQVQLAIFTNGKIIAKMWPFHVLCWLIPLVTSMLVFTTNTYGNDDDQDSWCFVTNSSQSPSWGQLFWEMGSFYLWLWICVLIINRFRDLLLLKYRTM